MIARKEALVIARNLRAAAEKRLKRSTKRSAKDAEKKASTDINSAVANGQFPYAQDRDGYPNWSFHLLRDIYPALISAERGGKTPVTYGRRAAIDIPERYAPLILLSDLRAILRGARRTITASAIVWTQLQCAIDAFDLRKRRYKASKDDVESIWTWSEHHRETYEESPPDHKTVSRDVRSMIESIQVMEDALSKKLGVFDLSKPPFRR